MFDPVMRDLDRHLSYEELAEAFQEAVENVQIDLCKEGCEFYPYTGSAVSEAISEASDEQLNIIGKLVADPTKAADLQKYLDAMTASYWYAQAETEAIKIVNRQMNEGEHDADY